MSKESLDIDKVIVGMEYCDFFMFSGGELIGLPDILLKRQKDLKILYGVQIGFLIILLFSIAIIKLIEVILGLILISVGIYSYQLKEKNIQHDIETINSYFQKNKEISEKDVVIFAKNEEEAVRAEKILEKYKNKDVENSELLFVFSKKIVLLNITYTMLLVFGIAFLIFKYLFISIWSFMILGFVFVYLVIDVISKIIDIINVFL